MTDFDDDAAGSIASAALAVLREQGPLSLEEWATHLEEYGTATELADVLEYLSEPMLGYLPNGKYVALDTVLEGLVFTHRLSEVEIASDILDASPDLEPILHSATARTGRSGWPWRKKQPPNAELLPSGVDELWYFRPNPRRVRRR